MEEIWADIPTYEGKYQVSNQGRVRSLDRKELMTGRHETPYYRARKGQIIKPRKGTYLIVALHDSKECCAFLVHRLVAKAFTPGHFLGAEVNHINEDKYDNRACNLEWCTRQENAQHSVKPWGKGTGSRIGTSKLKEWEVVEITEYLKQGVLSQVEIAEIYEVSNHAVHKIKAGQNWGWLTGFGKGVSQ